MVETKVGTVRVTRNIQIDGSKGRPILVDVFTPLDHFIKPVIIMSHGFKGFKDWGHWNAIARRFADAGYVFIKFNFSHNGTTAENPSEFGDLEAFGSNNYSTELEDLGRVIDWALETEQQKTYRIDVTKLHLIGHSRGGGISILKTAEDKRVRRLITWGSVETLDRFGDESEIARWQERGVRYIRNGRTGQEMPQYWQMVEDFRINRDRLSIKQALYKVDNPYLIIHGTNDETVSYTAALSLYQSSRSSELETIIGANHVFGGAHPFEGDDLPDQAQSLVNYSLNFLSRES